MKVSDESLRVMAEDPAATVGSRINARELLEARERLALAERVVEAVRGALSWDSLDALEAALEAWDGTEER